MSVTSDENVPKLLVFSANPSTTGQLNLPEEVARIQEGVRYFPGPIEVEHWPATTPTRLYRELLASEPTYVHFCGHGYGRKGLVLTDEHDGESLVTAEALGALFEHFRDTVQCVVLNACYSRIQARAIVEHIEYVVGMNAEIDDADATNFSVAFYDALSARRSVLDAFGLARAVMQMPSTSRGVDRSRHLVVPTSADLPNVPPRAGHLVPELFQRSKLAAAKKESPVAPRPPTVGGGLRDSGSLLESVRAASQPSRTRAEARLEPATHHGGGSNDTLITPIPREDTGPDVEAFLGSAYPLLLILGDSGYGKSTFLYHLASIENRDRNVCSLFYDVHQVELRGTLRDRLAEDLHSPPDRLVETLKRVGRLLAGQQSRLLILLDGINEARRLDPEAIRLEIESLAECLPKEIKILYSCRKVYWSLYLEERQLLPKKLYFGSSPFILRAYSLAESARAFEQYKRHYGLKGAFTDLPAELKEKIRDPLMLRMLSEGYAGRILPSFVPAVRVFQAYKERVARRFRATHVMEFLESVINFKARQLSGEAAPNYDDQLSEVVLLEQPEIARLHFAQLNDRSTPRKPLLLLEDEGVLQALDEDHTRFRFSYDRFYEFLLGRALGRKMLDDEGESFALDRCVEQHIDMTTSSGIVLWQALKSELIRRNLEPSMGATGLYGPEELFRLLEHPDPSASAFARELIRELIFEAPPSFADRLQQHADGDPNRIARLVDIAPDSLRMLPVLATALLDGDDRLARRVSHSLAELAQVEDAYDAFEELLLDKLEENVWATGGEEVLQAGLQGLIYYSAILFRREIKRGADPRVALARLWTKTLAKFPISREEKLRRVSSVLWAVIQEEGPKFFGDEARADGMEYVWEVLGDDLKERSMSMARCFVDCPPSLPPDVVETVKFFAAEQRNWSLRNCPEKDELYSYKIEFKLAEWLLIFWSDRSYGEVAQVLESLGQTDYWVTVDFALCNMEFILRHVHADDPRILRHGFERMKSWTRHFERDLAQGFYSTLDEADPFVVNYVPIAQLAAIDTEFFAPAGGPIPTLQERFVGSDQRALRLALLASRYLWREHPKKVLGSLRLLLDHDDPIVAEWLDHVLREIFLVYPRLVERFLFELDVDRRRALRIKHKVGVQDPSGSRHDIDTIMRFLFLGSHEMREAAVSWYGALLQSSGPLPFLEQLLSAVVLDERRA